jgi:hypothetical protein
MKTDDGKHGFLNTIITGNELICHDTDIQKNVMVELNTITEDKSSKCVQSLCEHCECIQVLMELFGET